jgi:hypothetical protein
MRNVSDRPMKNGGYWHPATAAPKFITKRQEPPTIDAESIMEELMSLTELHWVEKLGELLGVSCISLQQLGVAWAPIRVLRRFQEWRSATGAWAFPMRNGAGSIVGIRLRTNDGQKIAIKGSRDGLFVPSQTRHTAWVVEGPTDAAACLTLGCFGLGRPNCRGAIAHTQVTINRLGIERAIVVGERDIPRFEGTASPGLEGAQKLATELQIPVASMLLPSKDMRQFLNTGGTMSVLRCLERQLVWRQPE